MNKKLIKKQVNKYFKKLSKIEEKFYNEVNKLEKEMKKELGNDLILFWCDGSVVGIGNEDRTMKLIHRKYNE